VAFLFETVLSMPKGSFVFYPVPRDNKDRPWELKKGRSFAIRCLWVLGLTFQTFVVVSMQKNFLFFSKPQMDSFLKFLGLIFIFLLVVSLGAFLMMLIWNTGTAPLCSVKKVAGFWDMIQVSYFVFLYTIAVGLIGVGLVKQKTK